MEAKKGQSPWQWGRYMEVVKMNQQARSLKRVFCTAFTVATVMLGLLAVAQMQSLDVNRAGHGAGSSAVKSQAVSGNATAYIIFGGPRRRGRGA